MSNQTNCTGGVELFSDEENVISSELITTSVQDMNFTGYQYNEQVCLTLDPNYTTSHDTLLCLSSFNVLAIDDVTYEVPVQINLLDSIEGIFGIQLPQTNLNPIPQISYIQALYNAG